MRKKRGQISIEYLIVVGFVVFVIIGILGISYFYSSGVRDQIKNSQLESFAKNVISNSESVFYQGEPSQVTVTAYLPDGVQSMYVFREAGNEDLLVFNLTGQNDDSVVGFSSNVPISISGSFSLSEGVKKMTIVAGQNEVAIQEVP